VDRFNNDFAVKGKIAMPQNPDALNMLRRLDLNQYEAKAYFALSTMGKNTAGELSERAELPRPRIYDVLSSLQGKGFVAVQQGRPVRYFALPLLEAIKTLKKQRQSQLVQDLEKIERVGSELALKIAASGAVEKSGAEDAVWTLKGREAIYSKLASMIEESKRHVVLSTTPHGVRRKMGEHGKLLEKAKARGVKLHVLSQLDKSQAGEVTKIAKLSQTSLPTRFVLSDDQALVFLTPEGTDGDDEVALWVQNPHFAGTLKLFAKD